MPREAHVLQTNVGNSKYQSCTRDTLLYDYICFMFKVYLFCEWKRWKCKGVTTQVRIIYNLYQGEAKYFGVHGILVWCVAIGVADQGWLFKEGGMVVFQDVIISKSKSNKKNSAQSLFWCCYFSPRLRISPTALFLFFVPRIFHHLLRIHPGPSFTQDFLSPAIPLCNLLLGSHHILFIFPSQKFDHLKKLLFESRPIFNEESIATKYIQIIFI
jgi:hypothetical protein